MILHFTPDPEWVLWSPAGPSYTANGSSIVSYHGSCIVSYHASFIVSFYASCIISHHVLFIVSYHGSCIVSFYASCTISHHVLFIVSYQGSSIVSYQGSSIVSCHASSIVFVFHQSISSEYLYLYFIRVLIGELLEEVQCFKYLGSHVEKDELVETEFSSPRPFVESIFLLLSIFVSNSFSMEELYNGMY